MSLAVGKPVAEQADVADTERVGEVDEAPAVVEVLPVGDRLPVVHLRGGAQVRDHEAQGRQVLASPRQARARERRSLRKVHLAREAAELQGRIAEPVRLLEDLPTPTRSPRRALMS